MNELIVCKNKMDTKCREGFCIKCDVFLPSEFLEKRKKENDAYDKLHGPPSSKKMHLAEEPFPLCELPDLVIDKIWHQLCENDDMEQKFSLALHFIRPDFDIRQQSEDRYGPKYLQCNEFGRNQYEKYVARYHFWMPWELLRVATDEEYRRRLGLMLPKKLLDSFSDYLLNDFYDTAQYEFVKDRYERDLYSVNTDHNPEICEICKFVHERHFGWITKREFLCCEKFYASINLKLLKVLNKKIQKHFHGSVSYRTAAHTMLSNIVHRSDTIWDVYWRHEFYDNDKCAEPSHADHHVNSVLDLFKPIDENIQIKIKNKDVIQQTNVSGSIKEFPQFQKKSRRRTNSCAY